MAQARSPELPTPIPPYVRVAFRWEDPTKAPQCRLIPVREDDPRGPKVAIVCDQLGRPVILARSAREYVEEFRPPVVDCYIVNPRAAGVTPSEVVEFWEAEKAQRRQQRKATSASRIDRAAAAEVEAHPAAATVTWLHGSTPEGDDAV